jgi:hypothetical protein
MCCAHIDALPALGAFGRPESIIIVGDSYRGFVSVVCLKKSL